MSQIGELFISYICKYKKVSIDSIHEILKLDLPNTIFLPSMLNHGRQTYKKI